MQAEVIALPAVQKRGQRVYLQRSELSQILNVYGRQVADGAWRDYALDFEKDFACFSAFRRTSEAPLYRIVKEPGLRNRQGMWRIVGMDGRVLKRGRDLAALLTFFDKG